MIEERDRDVKVEILESVFERWVAENGVGVEGKGKGKEREGEEADWTLDHEPPMSEEAFNECVAFFFRFGDGQADPSSFAGWSIKYGTLSSRECSLVSTPRDPVGATLLEMRREQFWASSNRRTRRWVLDLEWE